MPINGGREDLVRDLQFQMDFFEQISATDFRCMVKAVFRCGEGIRKQARESVYAGDV